MENKEKLAQLIDKLWNMQQNTPKSLSKGNRINPLHILKFSSVHPSLNLQNEELLLACFENASSPFFLLTENSIFLLEENKSISIPINSNHKAIERGSFLEANEGSKTFLISLLTEFHKAKPERKTLDDFILKYKKIIKEEENNQLNPSLYFDGAYIEMLSQESEIITTICEELSRDKSFLNAVNSIFGEGNEAKDNDYQPNHLLLQDLIKVFNLLDKESNQKAKFTLAYIFEKLNGNDLGKGISIDRLNQLVDSVSFENNIIKIKSASFITLPNNYKNEFILPSILTRLNHPLLDKTGNAIYHFASIIAKADGSVTEDEKGTLKEILRKVKSPQVKIEGVGINHITDDDSLEKVMAELNELIGLENVKKAISDLSNFLTIQKERKSQGLKSNENSLHAVFIGPPGTGKTTVARLLARIYKHLSYLSSGHLVETDRSGLVAGYVGQTAIRVVEIVEQSKGGLLFIDEAYSLVQVDGGRDFGKEAIETLLKKMEDLRDDFVVVVAGYSEPMKTFINSNPGLRSRFSRYYEFEHFLPTQLLSIFKLQCTKSDFVLTIDAEDKLMEIFERLYERRDDGFGNARVVRNVFEKITEHQANRLIHIQPLTKEILMNIEIDDIPEILSTVNEVYAMQTKN